MILLRPSAFAVPGEILFWLLGLGAAIMSHHL